MNWTLLSEAVATTVPNDKVVTVLVSIIGSLTAIVVGQLVLMLKGDIITRKWHMERLADRDAVADFWKEEAMRKNAQLERVLGTAQSTVKVLDIVADHIVPASDTLDGEST